MPQPAPTYAEAPRPAMREPERYEAGPFIPPAPEAPMARPQRMPQIEDLPMPVQNQIRQQYASGDQADVKRRTLLERLAAFGMSRDDAPGATPERTAPQLGYQGQPATQYQRPPAPGPVHSGLCQAPDCADGAPPRPATA